MRYVDVVIPQDNMNNLAIWRKLKFDVMFVGNDWHASGKRRTLEVQFEEVGVRIVYFPYTQGTSSTLLNEILVRERDQLLLTATG